MKKLFESLMALDQNRPKLLVVDDQTINIKIFHTLFGGDCEIFMATDGKQAIQKCQQILPDLVLLDVMMPEIDGYEVCRVIKSDPLTKDIPIIFVTASMSDEDEVKDLNSAPLILFASLYSRWSPPREFTLSY